MAIHCRSRNCLVSETFHAGMCDMAAPGNILARRCIIPKKYSVGHVEKMPALKWVKHVIKNRRYFYLKPVWRQRTPIPSIF